MVTKYNVHQLNTIFYNFSNYCYIVEDETTKTAFIVDPAWELGKIANKLYSLDIGLDGILLTHSHYDHVNLVNPLIKRYQPNVYMAKAEIDYYGFRCSNLQALNHMDEISIGATKVICLHTPGHSAGGMCYLLSDSIFTGDTIFIEGCGICDNKGGSPEQMYESIQLVKGLLTPDILIYPSHSFGSMPGQNLDFVMKENIYFQIEDKGFFVEFRMRKNQKGIFDFK